MISKPKEYHRVNRRPETDYLMLTENALHEIRESERAKHKLERRSQALNQRIRNGYRWLENNSSFHPQYERGMQLVSELQSKHTETRWLLRDATMALWGHQLTFWGAWEHLTPLEQQAVIAKHGDIAQIGRPDQETWNKYMLNWQAEELTT